MHAPAWVAMILLLVGLGWWVDQRSASSVTTVQPEHSRIESTADPAPASSRRPALEPGVTGYLALAESREQPLAVDAVIVGRIFKAESLAANLKSASEGHAVTIPVAKGRWRLAALDPGQLLIIDGVRSHGDALEVVGPRVFAWSRAPAVVEVRRTAMAQLAVVDSLTGLAVHGVEVWARPIEGLGLDLEKRPVDLERWRLRPPGQPGDVQLSDPQASPVDVPTELQRHRILLVAPGYGWAALHMGASLGGVVELEPSPTLVVEVDPAVISAGATLTVFRQVEGLPTGLKVLEQELSGELRTTELLPGRYRVLLNLEPDATRAGPLAVMREVVLLAGEECRVAWEDLPSELEGARVEGRLRIDSSMANAEPRLQVQRVDMAGAAGTALPLELTLAGVDGDTMTYTFAHTDVPQAEVFFTLAPSGMRFQRVLTSGKNVVELDATGSALRTLTFLSSSSGAVITPTLLQLSCEPHIMYGEWALSTAPIHVTRAQPDPTFLLPPGTLSYTLMAQGYGWSSGTIEIVDGLNFYEVAVDPLLELELTVTRPDGSAVACSREWFNGVHLIDATGALIPVVSRSFKAAGGIPRSSDRSVANHFEGTASGRPSASRSAIFGVRATGNVTLVAGPLAPFGDVDPVELVLPAGWESGRSPLSVAIVVGR